MKHILTAGAAAAFLVLAGCASAPDAPPELLAARSAVQSAESDPAVLNHAPNELRRATASLSRANSLLAQRESLAEVTSASYVAQQQARTAIALARAKTDEEAIKTAEADRERARADMRTAEAQRAQARAYAAEGRAASAEGRAANADARAMTAEQRAAMANADAAAAQASASEAQAQAQALAAQLAEMRARPTDRGALVTLGDVLFEFNRADIKATASNEMRKLAEFLKKHPERQVLIEGHTDDIGSDAYNETLSRRRAEAVANALSALGVQSPRVTAIGYGEAYPVASNTSDTNRAMNRRVEVYISDNDQPVRPRTPGGVAAAGQRGG